jgi:hypothetical protein
VIPLPDTNNWRLNIGMNVNFPSGVPTSRTSPALSFLANEKKTPFVLLLLKYAIQLSGDEQIE